MPCFPSPVAILQTSVARAALACATLSLAFLSVGVSASRAQVRSEIKTGSEVKSEPESSQAAKPGKDSANTAASPSNSASKDTDQAAEKAGEADGDDDDAKSRGQFRKAVSPSGLQLGLSGPEATKEFPEELRQFAEDGALASAAKQWQKAKTAYQSMVDAAPGHPLALANLGTVEFRLEEYEAARDHLRQSLSIAPSVAHHWLVLALCYYELEDLDLAMSCLFRARHEDKTDPRVHLYLAVMARDYGWQSAAEMELQRAIMLDPQYVDAHYNLAMLYLERNPPSYELARRHYYFALDLGGKPDREIEKILRDATINR